MKTKRSLIFGLAFVLAVMASGCRKAEEPSEAVAQEFKWQVDQFADLRILRYQVPGFENLPPAQKELIYYLGQAALCGRDIITDQNYKHNLTIRKTLDVIVQGYQGDRTDPQWEKFMVYTKRVWFSNGIHHHYSTDKFIPEFTPDYFASLVKESPGAPFPLAEGQSLDDLIAFLNPVLFDPSVDAKKVSQDPAKDLVTHSAVNFYEGVTQQEVEHYYQGIMDEDDPTPVSYGLNSKVVKKEGKVTEEV